MQFSLFTTRLFRSLLIFTAIPVLFVFSWSAIASSETSDVSSTIKVLEIDMSAYTPVQTEWSEKAKVNYEKRKSRDGLPIAMLTIERLNLEAPVYFGTDRITLDRGLGMVEGTAYPDEVGNIAISGHRDGFFRPLKDIRLGDAIDVQTPAGTQTFEVSDISIVDALEVSVLDPTDTTVLTLITCHPFYYQGYAPDRYIVLATPVGSNANGSNLKLAPVTTKEVPLGKQ